MHPGNDAWQTVESHRFVTKSQTGYAIWDGIVSREKIIMTNQDYFWFIISIAFLAAVAVLWLLKKRKLRRARTWPTEAGHVDSTGLKLQQTGATSSVWVAEVHYSYTVQGAAYSGKLRRSYLLKNRAEKWMSNYRSEVPLLVRYNPGKAKDSVVFEDEQTWVNVG